MCVHVFEFCAHKQVLFEAINREIMYLWCGTGDAKRDFIAR